jgi:O-glycosyl hydrolase
LARKSLNFKNKKLFFCVVIPFLLFACSRPAGGNPININSSGNTDGTMNIRFNEFRQEIDGFGGSNAWTRLPHDEETAEELVKLLFSRTEGMGFTILRTRLPFRERLAGDDSPGLNDGFVVRRSDDNYDYRINPDGTKTFNLNWNTWDISGTRGLIRHIKALGGDGPEELIIKSTPWTPPNNRVTRWKEDVVGVSSSLDYVMDWSRPDWWGRLRRDKYEDYADLLADYVKNFEQQMGAPLAILSVQNEPNWKVQYESAYWNGEDIRDFIKVIGERFPMKGITVGPGGLGIMAPEYENFNVPFNAMIKPMLDDPISERILTHIGLHQYNGGFDSSPRAGAMEFPGIIASGKRFWQTEVSGSGPHLPPGKGIDNALYYARMIHFDMTLAQTNAFLYWWLWTNNVNDENFPGSLIMVDYDEIVTALRLYAMGQYSRFIRPGWVRIDADTYPVRGRGVYSSAYRNPQTNEIAIVIINDTITSLSVSLNLSGAEFSELEAWRTSANERLEPAGRQRVSRNTASVNLSPRSITTFYGLAR